MISACEKAEAKLGVIFRCRFSNTSQRVKKTIEEDKLGSLILGDTYVKLFRSQAYYESADWRCTRSKERGRAPINRSIHFIELLQWFMGSVDWLCGTFGTMRHLIEVEDIGVVILKFKNGTIVVTGEKYSHLPWFSLKLELHGEKVV